MKPLFYTVCLLAGVVTFSSCHKVDVAKTSLASESIVGTWELRVMQGGMLPARELPPGNGSIVHFTATHYTRYENNAVVQTGTYDIFEDSTVSKTVGLLMPPGKFNHRIVMKNDENKHPTFIDIEDNKLSLVSGYFPLDYGTFHQYEKVEADH